MALFEEQGFESTSTIEIAKRARVTTRTFFRYFADKQEVLFADSADLNAVLVESILKAPSVAEPLQVVTQVLTEFDWESMGSRGSQRQRHAVIAANPELLERDLAKQHLMAVGFVDALRQRGVDADVAQLAASVGTHVFRTAYERWLGADDDTTLATICASVMSDLSKIVPASAAASSSPRTAA